MKKQLTAKQTEKAKAKKQRIAFFVRNIKAVYRKATNDEITRGLKWYAEAFRLAAEYGDLFGIDTLTASYLIAALSPNNGWSGNLLDFCKVAKAHNSGLLEFSARNYDAAKRRGFRAIGCQTYPLNVFKASEILKGNFEALSGNKVTAFQDNIYNTNSLAVTIDVHAASLVNNARYTSRTVSKVLSKGNYCDYVSAYRKAAESLGLIPKELQAITWLAWRRLQGFHNYLDNTTDLHLKLEK